MNCQEIKSRLDAYLDEELPAAEAKEVCRHLETCLACKLQAEALQQMATALDRLPPLAAPPTFYQNTLRAYRKRLTAPGFAEWWQNLTIVMRSAVCGATLAGLLCGAVMATSLVTAAPQDGVGLYQTLYATNEGFYP